jgi:hypothetical protein
MVVALRTQNKRCCANCTRNKPAVLHHTFSSANDMSSSRCSSEYSEPLLSWPITCTQGENSTTEVLIRAVEVVTIERRRGDSLTRLAWLEIVEGRSVDVFRGWIATKLCRNTHGDSGCGVTTAWLLSIRSLEVESPCSVSTWYWNIRSTVPSRGSAGRDGNGAVQPAQSENSNMRR